MTLHCHMGAAFVRYRPADVDESNPECGKKRIDDEDEDDSGEAPAS
jgi:hypothetical protein